MSIVSFLGCIGILFLNLCINLNIIDMYLLNVLASTFDFDVFLVRGTLQVMFYIFPSLWLPAFQL